MAFEAFPRSLAWELITQSGEIQTDDNGDQYGVHYAQPGDILNMSVTVKNLSRNPAAEIWYGTSALIDEGPDYPNAHAIGIGTWGPMDHVPYFLDSSSFVINNNRFTYYDGEAVARGENMTLNFQVKITEGLADGAYNLVTSLVREFDEWGWRDNGDGTNHRHNSILWQLVVGDATDVAPPTQQQTTTATGDSTVNLYSPQGSDISFRYPDGWNIFTSFPALADYPYGLGYVAVGPESTAQDDDIIISLYPVGTTLEAAIEQFHNALNSTWQSSTRIINPSETNPNGESVQYVNYSTSGGSAQLHNWFVTTSNGLIVLVRADNAEHHWAVEGIVQTLQ